MSPVRAKRIILVMAAAFAPMAAAAQVTYSPARGAYFNQDTSIGVNTALGVTNTQALFVAYWMQGTYNATNNSTILNGTVVLSDPASYCENAGTGRTAKGLCQSYDSSASVQPPATSTNGGEQFSFNDSIGTGAANYNPDTTPDSVVIRGNGGVAGVSAVSVIDGVWTQYIYAVDTKHGACAVVMNGVNAIGTNFHCPPNIGSGEFPDLNNAAGLHIMNGQAKTPGGAATTAWLSDLMIGEEGIVCYDTIHPIVLANGSYPCTAPNTIPQGIINNFYYLGRPVYLGANGSAPTGRQPEVFLTGDGADFAVNKGAAPNPLSVLGDPLYTTAIKPMISPAPFGPVGMAPGQPTLKWFQGLLNGGHGATSFAVAPNGADNPVAVGDLLVLAVSLVGGTPHTITCPTTGGGWTAGNFAPDAPGSTNFAFCYKFATAAEAGTKLTVPVSWTNPVTRISSWALFDYAQAASAHLMTCTPNPNGATISTPAGTTTYNGSTVVSFFENWGSAGYTVNYTPPATDEVRYRSPSIGANPQIYVTDQYNVPAGTSTLKTLTMSQKNYGGMGCTMELTSSAGPGPIHQ